MLQNASSSCFCSLNRFVATSKRRDEYLKTYEPEQEQDDDGKREGDDGIPRREYSEENSKEESGGESSDSANARITPVVKGEAQEGSRSAGMGQAPEEDGQEGVTPGGKDDSVAATVVSAAERSRIRQAERDLIEEQLEKEALALFQELRECTTYHDL